MMKMNKPAIYALALSIALPLTLSAKDLKTEITVDRTIVPVEREASRPTSLTPQALTFSSKLRQLSLTDYTTPAELTRTAPALSPAAYADTFAISPYRGYASLGYFPAFNLGTSAGYRLIDKTKTRLGAWLQYDGYSYKATGEQKGSGSYKNNTFTLGAHLDQLVGSKSSLGASVAYTFAGTGTPEFDNYLTKSQGANMFDVDLSWWSRKDNIAYHVNADYSYFGFTKDARYFTEYLFDAPHYSYEPPYHGESTYKAACENHIIINSGIAFLGSSNVPTGGIEFKADVLDGNKTLGIISFLPYYSFESGNVHGRLGAKLDISAGGRGKKLHIAPSVMLDWNPASQVAVYANIEGGEHQNTLRSLYEYCPFMESAWYYQRSNIPVSFDLGLNVGPFKGFSAKLFGGYAIANHWLMPTEVMMIDYISMIYSNKYHDYNLKGFHAGVGLSYQYRSLGKISVTAETASHGENKGYYLWRDRAKYVVNADIECNPMAKLKIDLGLEWRTGRRAYFIEQFDYLTTACPAKVICLGAMSNFHVGASYSLTDAFTIFARGENLLNQRCYLAPDIQAQGLKGLIGVNYKF